MTFANCRARVGIVLWRRRCRERRRCFGRRRRRRRYNVRRCARRRQQIRLPIVDFICKCENEEIARREQIVNTQLATAVVVVYKPFRDA